MRFELDAAMRRGDEGRLLLGGVPPRLVRLSVAGAAALDRALGEDAPDRAAAAIVDRLVAAGLLHPLPDDGGDGPAVTTVIPVRDGGDALGELVRAVAAEGPVIVVDDRSRDDSAERAGLAGARVIANAGRPGPAGARNTGLRAATTKMVAFLDADCIVEPGWRDGLAGLLDADPGLAMVAPRVRSTPGDTVLARYERRASPLDLGPSASRVGHRSRVSYLPTAALLARRDALLELGGFDETMRFGEDVDLIWRLLDAGRSARYVPSREVHHQPRATLRGLAAQRVGYGSSAVPLAARHGAAVAPLRLGRHTAAVWLTAALRPGATPIALAGSLAIVASRGKDRDSRIALARLVLDGHANATGQLARALLREWLPISLVLGLKSRRARRGLTVAVAIEAGRAGGAMIPRAIDHGAYAVGIWGEALRRRNLAALVPRSQTDAEVAEYGDAGRA
jgi:mycofactocin system glycosyltransferase